MSASFLLLGTGLLGLEGGKGERWLGLEEGRGGGFHSYVPAMVRRPGARASDSFPAGRGEGGCGVCMYNLMEMVVGVFCCAVL